MDKKISYLKLTLKHVFVYVMPDCLVDDVSKLAVLLESEGVDNNRSENIYDRDVNFILMCSY